MGVAVPSSQAAEKPRVLFFYSPTDGYSRRVEGFLAQVLQRRRNHQTFDVVRIDVRARPEIAERFRVVELPALYVVADRKVVRRQVKPRGCEELVELLRPWLR
jgi:thioredoxin-like negative regulator of GroEL